MVISPVLISTFVFRQTAPSTLREACFIFVQFSVPKMFNTVQLLNFSQFLPTGKRPG